MAYFVHCISEGCERKGTCGRRIYGVDDEKGDYSEYCKENEYIMFLSVKECKSNYMAVRM